MLKAQRIHLHNRPAAARGRVAHEGIEVSDWAFSYPEESDGPALVTSVHGSSLDFPDVTRRLKALVDRAAYHSFVD